MRMLLLSVIGLVAGCASSLQHSATGDKIQGQARLAYYADRSATLSAESNAPVTPSSRVAHGDCLTVDAYTGACADE